MDKKLPALLIFLITGYCSYSQNVGIGTAKPDSSAVLDITSANKGMLIPRMSLGSINAIPLPAKGLLAFDSVANQVMVNVGAPAAPNWQPVAGSTGGAWSLNGNRGTNPANQFVGTTDNEALHFRVNNLPVGKLDPVSGNIFWGLQAGQADTAGFSNIAIGPGALQFNGAMTNMVAVGDSALMNNTGGSNNTAVGSKALLANTSGSFNTATGFESLIANTTGSFNTATGFASLFANTTGSSNAAYGEEALAANTSGGFNTAIGEEALVSNITAINNTAVGFQAMFSNTTGNSNTATGASSLFSNTTGSGNVANGISALFSNTTGSNNTALGFEAMLFNNTGSDNIAVGSSALFSNGTGNGNIAIGVSTLANNTTGGFNVAVGNGALGANTTSSDNVAIGDQALGATNITGSLGGNTAVGEAAGSGFNLGTGNTLIGSNSDAWGNGATNCTALGADAKCTKDNQVFLGNTLVTSITGFPGFSQISDGRVKKNIKEDVKGIAFIMKLRPVTYQMDITALNNKLGASSAKHAPTAKSIAEAETIVHTGFIAQEVEQAAKDLGYDFSGVDKPQKEGGLYALRYAEFVVPLVKAAQEQQLMIDELKNRHSSLENEVEALKKSDADQEHAWQDLQRRIEKLESSLKAGK
jgi:hypothetical protein